MVRMCKAHVLSHVHTALDYPLHNRLRRRSDFLHRLLFTVYKMIHPWYRPKKQRCALKQLIISFPVVFKFRVMVYYHQPKASAFTTTKRLLNKRSIARALPQRDL